jgi:hypothetical protein
MVQTSTSQSENGDGSRVPVKRVVGILIVMGLIALVAWGAYEAWRRSSAKSEGGDGTTTTESTATGGGDSTTLSTAGGGGDTTTSTAAGGDGTTTTGSAAGDGTTNTSGTSAPASGLSVGAAVGLVFGLMVTAVVLFVAFKIFTKKGHPNLAFNDYLRKRDYEKAKKILDRMTVDNKKSAFNALRTHMEELKNNYHSTERAEEVRLYLLKDVAFREELKRIHNDTIQPIIENIKSGALEREIRERMRIISGTDKVFKESLLPSKVVTKLQPAIDSVYGDRTIALALFFDDFMETMDKTEDEDEKNRMKTFLAAFFSNNTLLTSEKKALEFIDIDKYKKTRAAGEKGE